MMICLGQQEKKRLEDDKRQIRNDLNREKENLRQQLDNDKKDADRRIRDLEDKLRRISQSHVQSGGTDIRIEDNTLIKNGNGGADLRHKFEMEKSELERKFITEKNNMQQEFDRLLQQVCLS